MTFNNASIQAPVPNKPHIVKINGFWRVSAAPSKLATRPLLVQHRWHEAHKFAGVQNLLRSR